MIGSWSEIREAWNLWKQIGAYSSQKRECKKNECCWSTKSTEKLENVLSHIVDQRAEILYKEIKNHVASDFVLDFDIWKATLYKKNWEWRIWMICSQLVTQERRMWKSVDWERKFLEKIKLTPKQVALKTWKTFQCFKF